MKGPRVRVAAELGCRSGWYLLSGEKLITPSQVPWKVARSHTRTRSHSRQHEETKEDGTGGDYAQPRNRFRPHPSANPGDENGRARHRNGPRIPEHPTAACNVRKHQSDREKNSPNHCRE